MPPDAVIQTLAYVWDLLRSSGTRSALAGGMAVSYWGSPRSTQDVDFAMLAKDDHTVSSTFLSAGFRRKNGKSKELGLFQLSQWVFEPRDTYVDVAVDLMLSTSDYYTVALSRTVQANLIGVPVAMNVLSREDLILHKLYADQLIDLADIASLLEMHWNDLEMDYLSNWTCALTLDDAWKAAISRHQS